MSACDQIRRLTGCEERLLAVHDALSALVDDEDALLVALSESPGPQMMTEQFKKTRNTARHAVNVVRSKLRRLGCADAR